MTYFDGNVESRQAMAVVLINSEVTGGIFWMVHRTGEVVAGDHDTCAWGEGFWNGISAISHKTAGEATIVADVSWKCGDWKTVLVETKCGWAIVVLSEWIVEDASVCFIIMVNYNAI